MSSDPRIQAEKLALRAARAKGPLATVGAYLRFSGPGWLLGAITLGGGSLAGSLYLGVIGGYSMLWLQVIAMIMGIIMLSAITYVTLSTGKRPFRAIQDHINPVLAWGWAIATLLANVVWALPQFSLGTAAVLQNLAPGLQPAIGGSEVIAKAIVCALLLGISTVIIWFYDTGHRGIRIFEYILKGMVALVVLCFFGVVIKLAISPDGLSWGSVFGGLVPDFSLISRPAASFSEAIGATGEFSAHWTRLIVSEQRDIMITAVATAVGINMTFLLPYSMLRKGWDRDSRGLAIFDLSTGLFIPFVLATGCVVIATASQFHARPQPGVVDGTAPAGLIRQYEGLLKGRLAAEIGRAQVDGFERLSAAGTDAAATLEAVERGEIRDLNPELIRALEALVPLRGTLKSRLNELPEGDKAMAAMLIRRDAFNLAASLERLTGKTFSHYIFGLGVLGMALSTIIILMLISGFTICEIFNLPHTGTPHRLACMLSGIGVLGPFIYHGQTQFWLAVPTSVFGMTLLPIAYFTFFLMINNRNIMGHELLRGGKRVAANIAILTALLAAGFCAAWSVWAKAGYYGVAAVSIFIALAVIVHFVRPPKQVRLSPVEAKPVEKI